MRTGRWGLVLVAAVVLFLPRPAVTDQGWEGAEGSRQWSFPADHGSHREFRTEWWYVTGHLREPGGKRYGFQLTFFRVGAQREPLPEGNRWAVRDLYAAHFALTDPGSGTFRYAERLSRRGPGLSGALEGSLNVWLLDWRLAQEGGEMLLEAGDGEMELSLRLTSREPPLLHGEGGLSRKGSRRGQASWYYSLTDLEAAGTLRLHRKDPPVEVQGWGWLDHEFGSNQLAVDQEGWDWFGLRLDDGCRLMIYILRKTDGSLERHSSGTLRLADGRARHLGLEEIRIDVLDTWASTASEGRYPSRWRIAIPSEDIAIEIEPILAGQELVTSRSTGVTYWEGAVRGEGRSEGRPVTAEGYVEMTGYAGTMGGLF